MNIPSLPVDALINLKTGDMSDSWRNFFDILLNELQTNASNEGLVSPTQNSTNIGIIESNTLQNGSYTLQYGTCLYNSSANTMMFAINNGSGVPVFKTVTLT